MANKTLFCIFIVFLICLNLNSQTIINTENMMSEINDDLSYKMSFQGDFNFGNIDLLQFSTGHQFAKTSGSNLIRLLFNYEYTTCRKSF